MAKTIVINSLEQLRQYLNEDGVIEIAMRGKKKRFRAFQKIVLNSDVKDSTADTLKKVVGNLDRGVQLDIKQIKLLQGISRVGQLSAVFSCMNLCATCAGFAVMYKKLDSLSDEISAQFAQLQASLNKRQDILSDTEFHKLLEEYMNMLDRRKRQDPYAEGEMRALVSQEVTVLKMLIQVFFKELTDDYMKLIICIYSLLSMLTVSLQYYDEQYYYTAGSSIKTGEVWHTSHDEWMRVYQTLTSEEFIEKLQDVVLFDIGMGVSDADAYCVELLDHVLSQEQDVKDNQELIVALGDAEKLRAVREWCNQQVREGVQEAMAEAGIDEDDSEIVSTVDDVMRQIAWA